MDPTRAAPHSGGVAITIPNGADSGGAGSTGWEQRHGLTDAYIRPRSPSPTRQPLIAKHGAAAGAAPLSVSASAGAGAAPQAARHRLRQRLMLLVVAGAWVLSSSGAILLNKVILVDLSFPFPFTTVSMGMLGSWVASTLLVRMPGVVAKRAPPVTLRLALTWLIPTGFVMASSLYFGSVAYLYLSVAFIQMMKALTPAVTMLVAFGFGHEDPTPPLIAAVVLMSSGVMGASYGELRFQLIGFLAMLASILAEALRLNIMQRLMAAHGFHPLEALRVLAPACAAWMLAAAAATEAPRMAAEGKFSVMTGHPWHFAAAGLAGFATNAASFGVVNLSSALTLKVLAICKDAALVAFGAAVLREAVGFGQAAGYAVSLCGVALYTWIKSRPAPPK